MIAHKWVDIPEYISLLIVVGILLFALLASLLFPVREKTPAGASNQARQRAKLD